MTLNETKESKSGDWERKNEEVPADTKEKEEELKFP